jgi:hypothetical protein
MENFSFESHLPFHHIGPFQNSKTSILGFLFLLGSSGKRSPNCDANANYTLRFHLDCKPLKTGELRFERSQVLVWMDELVALGKVHRWSNLPEHLDVGESLLVEFIEAA